MQTSHIKRASLGQVASWVSTARQDISQELVTKVFKKCAISNSLHGSEDCALQEEEGDKGYDD